MEHSLIFTKLNYWVFIILMMIGLWAMISKQNLIKKIMGMSIFQASVILFYVSIATKDPGASIPIYPHELIHPPTVAHSVAEGVPSDQLHGHTSIAAQVNPDDYDNPLPHVLMLTAIVVGVATLGVALSLVQRIYRLYGTIEENEVLAAMAKDPTDGLTLDIASPAHPESNGSHA